MNFFGDSTSCVEDKALFNSDDFFVSASGERGLGVEGVRESRNPSWEGLELGSDSETGGKKASSGNHMSSWRR